MLVALEARALPEQTAGACTVVLITHGPVSRIFRMPASLSCSPARTPTSSIKARHLIARSQAVSSPPSGPGFSASVLPGEPPGAARFLRTVGWCNGNTSGPYPGECGFDSRPCMRHLTGCASRSPAGERSGIGLYGVPAAKPRLQLRRRALFPCIGGTDTFQPEENIMPCGKKKGGGKRK